MTDAAASSPAELPYDPHAHLRTDAVRFLEIVADHGFDHAVPSCPGWNLGDLAWQLRRQLVLAGSALPVPLAEEERLVRPDGHDGLHLQSSPSLQSGWILAGAISCD